MGGKKKKITENYEVRVSKNAISDLDQITGRIAFLQHQPGNALKVGDEIEKTIEKIATNPYSYKECEELQTKTKIYRRATCLSWLIIYKIQQNGILVLGIIHQARKPTITKNLRKLK